MQSQVRVGSAPRMRPELRENLEVQVLHQAGQSLGFLQGEPGRGHKDEKQAGSSARTRACAHTL